MGKNSSGGLASPLYARYKIRREIVKQLLKNTRLSERGAMGLVGTKIPFNPEEIKRAVLTLHMMYVAAKRFRYGIFSGCSSDHFFASSESDVYKFAERKADELVTKIAPILAEAEIRGWK